MSFELVVPSGYSIVRNESNFGATITGENLGGLTEIEKKITEIDGGVKLFWKLKNDKSIPVTGLKAVLKLEIKGRRSTPQADAAELYSSIRKRLVEQFWFEGRIANARYDSPDGAHVHFGDQTIYMGQAMIAFATEMAILRKKGGDVTDARNRLKVLISAFNELDLKAEKKFGGPTPLLDGFFVRDDITGADDPRLGNKFKFVKSDWQVTDIDDASPSLDQIFGLMCGLSAVVKFSEDAELSKEAQAISARLFDYAARNKFILKLPNGTVNHRGADMRLLATLLNNLNEKITGEDHFAQMKVEFNGIPISNILIRNVWASDTTAELVREIAGKKLDIKAVLGNLGLPDISGVKVPKGEIALNSFAIHILLMTLAPTDAWTQDQVEDVAIRSNHELSILMYCALHKCKPTKITAEQIVNLLTLVPPNGPTASAELATGWHHDNRWIRSSKLSEPNQGPEEFNGLDWLMLFNLQQLVFGEN